ncbi:MAG: hypothetical protein ACM3UU_00100 [Ignavibacteriales bacterium]
MYIPLATRQAYSEIDAFLKILDDYTVNKIPPKLREFFEREKDKNYVKEISTDIPISEQNLKKETLAIIALLNLKYWCDDEEEKVRLKKIYAENEKTYQSSK